ncbi:MAG: hypothetical protein IJU23_02755 [Proteobacteria bacterium]|nr:hypothetical protein [Pseudomonadota bacterium]
MIRIKSAVLLTLLIAALTGSVIFLSGTTSPLTNDTIESEYERLNDTLHDKLLNAENSLNLQAITLSTDKELVSELGALHDKLMSASPEDLKKNMGSNWNKKVFDKLISWKAQRKTEISAASTSESLKVPSASATTLTPEINWWKKVPDLVIAFATVPFKDGKISNINIAEGNEGKQLAKSLKYDIPILNEVSETSTAKFGHFTWGSAMYLVVASPVMRDGNQIGTVVVGYELSKNLLSSFSKAMPPFVKLSLVYTGKTADGDKSQNYLFADSTETETILKKTGFQTLSNASNDGGATQSFDNLLYNRVYAGNYDNESVSVRRTPWAWDESHKTDIYIMASSKAANAKQKAFNTKVLIAGAITLFLGLIFMLMLIAGHLKKLAFIKQAFATSMSKGEPIDPNALALFMDEKADALGQYVIQPVQTEEEETEEEWDVLMDFTDEANNKADAALAQEEKDKLKNAADVEEAKPIYEEYMRLRKENNITSPMDFDTFLRRLQRNAEKIKTQYHCENVTFQVHVVDGNVLLKPKIVKKGK